MPGQPTDTVMMAKNYLGNSFLSPFVISPFLLCYTIVYAKEKLQSMSYSSNKGEAGLALLSSRYSLCHELNPSLLNQHCRPKTRRSCHRRNMHRYCTYSVSHPLSFAFACFQVESSPSLMPFCSAAGKKKHLGMKEE